MRNPSNSRRASLSLSLCVCVCVHPFFCCLFACWDLNTSLTQLSHTLVKPIQTTRHVLIQARRDVKLVCHIVLQSYEAIYMVWPMGQLNQDGGIICPLHIWSSALGVQPPVSGSASQSFSTLARQWKKYLNF